MLLAADESHMTNYAGLVQDPAIRNRMMAAITGELALSRRMMDEVFGSSPTLRRPRLLHSQQWRQEPLKALHARQVWLLREWRSGQEDLLPELLLTVNAIASALRTTG